MPVASYPLPKQMPIKCHSAPFTDTYMRKYTRKMHMISLHKLTPTPLLPLSLRFNGPWPPFRRTDCTFRSTTGCKPTHASNHAHTHTHTHTLPSLSLSLSLSRTHTHTHTHTRTHSHPDTLPSIRASVPTSSKVYGLTTRGPHSAHTKQHVHAAIYTSTTGSGDKYSRKIVFGNLCVD